MKEPAYTWITTGSELRRYCQRLAQCKSIALDTEFVSERTYRPVLCLIQVAADEELALIDAVALPQLRLFWKVLAEPGHETIVHAGRVEVEFSLEAIGEPPAGLFDVQVAAGLVGIDYPAGYSTLISKLLDVETRKEETRTDWRRRPLSQRQINYALDDIRYLPAIRDKLRARLQQLDRAAWMAEEMALWEQEVVRGFSHERWRRVSGNAGLDRQSLAIVRELWRWREEEAKRRNCPPRRVLRDDLLVELARRRTADPKRVHAVRGLERPDLRRQLPKIAEAIERAMSLDEAELPQVTRGEGKPRLSVLGQFLFSALGSMARQMDIAPGLVGSPNDVRDWIVYRAGQGAADKPPLLAQGWRAQVVGKLFDELLAGRLAIRVADCESEHPLVFEPIPPCHISNRSRGL